MTATIAKARAEGGGDLPEDVAGGLKVCMHAWQRCGCGCYVAARSGGCAVLWLRGAAARCAVWLCARVRTVGAVCAGVRQDVVGFKDESVGAHRRRAGARRGLPRPEHV